MLKSSILLALFPALVMCNETLFHAYMSTYENKSLANSQDMVKAYWDLNVWIDTKKKNTYKQLMFLQTTDKLSDIQSLLALPWTQVKQPNILKKWEMVLKDHEYQLPEAKLWKFVEMQLDFEDTFRSSQFTAYDHRISTLKVYTINELFATSEIVESLTLAWTNWMAILREENFEKFKEYMELTVFIARANKYSDIYELWDDMLAPLNVKKIMNELWDSLSLFYKQLHSYVRSKLRNKPDNIMEQKGSIPVHMLGNIWGKSWDNLFNLTMPFPDKEGAMFKADQLQRVMTTMSMFESVAYLFASMNFTNVPDKFWKSSIFNQEINNTNFNCNPAAVDFFTGKDYRIRSCFDVGYKNFLQAHKLYATTIYQMQYSNQSFLFRKPSSFMISEALTDIFTIIAQNSAYLKKLRIGVNETESYEKVINKLYNMALFKLPNLAYHKALSDWKYQIISGRTKLVDSNCKFWDIIFEVQGVEPPVDRTTKDFDPAGYEDVMLYRPYYAVFLSTIVQYQIFRKLCIDSGEYGHNSTKHLFQCNLSNKMEVGNVIKEVMSYGTFQPWQYIFQKLTNDTTIKIDGFLEYFQPLIEWLVNENKQQKNPIGWKNPIRKCKA